MTEPLRVLHLIKSLGRGGAEMLLPETLRFHDHQHFTWTYGYFLPWKNQVVEPLRIQGSEVICFSARNNMAILLRIPTLVRFIREKKIDLIHCHLPWAGIAGRLAAKWLGTPIVYTEHNKQERYHALTRRMNLLTLGWNNQVIAVSGEVSDSIHRFKPGLPVVTIHNGVDTARFAPQETDIRKQLRIGDHAVVIGNVCVFRKQKRLREWLDVAHALCRDHADVYFILVGDGPERADLIRYMETLGITDRIHWLGLQHDVRPYYAAMDIFMLTSEFEGLPVALLEAMAMEKAVVVTAAGGIPEVVEDGVSGLLVPVDQPTACHRRVNELLTDRSRIGRIGKAARNRVIGDFSIETMVKKLEALYENVGPH